MEHSLGFGALFVLARNYHVGEKYTALKGENNPQRKLPPNVLLAGEKKLCLSPSAKENNTCNYEEVK